MGLYGPGERRPAARRKPRRSPSKAAARPKGPVGVRAPAPQGVFAQSRPKAPDVAQRGRAQRKVQRAEERLPGTTLPVKRLPTIAKPTHEQAKAIVREQTAALSRTSIADKQRAGRGNADRETRTQIRNARAASDKLDRDAHVAAGVAEITRDPKAYGLSDGHVKRLHALAKKGKLPKGIRGAVARVGATKQRDGGALAVPAREREAHGAHAGLEAVAGLKIGKAAGILAVASADAAEKARQHLNKGSGGFEHGSLLTNASKDALHFPYDVVNSGVEVTRAGADLARGRPGRAAALGKGTANTLVETVKHPLKSAGEHPLDTALTFAGGVGAVGRGAGALSRGAGAASRKLPKGGGRLGRGLRAAGDTRRPDLVLEPGARGLRTQRSYSKNLIVALEQKRRDRVDTRKGIGDRKGIQFRGSDRRRRRLQRQAVHEFQDFQQNTGRTEREVARRETQTAAGARVQSRRQNREVRAEKLRQRLITSLRAKGVTAPERMSALELARAAKQHGLATSPRRAPREYAAAKKANVRQRAERAVPTKIRTPRRPFSAGSGATRHLRPERDLLVPAAKQLLGDVRSSPAQVVASLHSEIGRLEKAFTDHGHEMDLAGRRRNRARVGAMKAFAGDLTKGGPKAERRLKALMTRAEEYRRVAANVSRKHVKAKTLTAEQARAAAFMDYAVSRYAGQGVRYDERRAPTDADAAVYGAAKGNARTKAAEARSAGQGAARARVEARTAGVRGRQVQGRRAARKRMPGTPRTGPAPAKAEQKAQRRAAEKAAVVRRAASAELHVHEEKLRAAVASAREEHRKAGKVGDDLKAAVATDPRVVAAISSHKAARGRLGKVAAKTKAERRADALWVRERVAAKKAQDARAAASSARRAVPGKPREFVRGLVVERDSPALAKVDEMRARGEAITPALNRAALEEARRIANDGIERKLTQGEIEERFRGEYGPDAAAPAFVSARPDAQGAGAYFVNWLGRSGSRKSADTYGKTGRSEALGINAHGEQAAIDALVHTQGVVSAAKNWDRFVGAFGVKSPRGELMTWDEAEEMARALREGLNDELPGRGPYVPVRVAPGRYDQTRIEEILRGQAPADAEQPKGVISSKVAEALAGRPPEDRATARNVVLVPEHVLATFGKHQEMTTSELAKLGQAATNAFRSSVLPLSTKWLTGNVAEGVLRLAVAGVTPIDVALGRRYLRDLIEKDAEWGTALQARTQGGLLYGTADRLAVHRDRTMFDETALEGVARGGQALRHLPVVKQAIDGYMAFAHGVFTFNKWIEQQFQAGVVGKEVRRRVQEDTQSWSRSWQVAVGLGRDAYRDALNGATNTPAQVRFARAIDETLGKYSRFSPQMRRVTQTMAPFLPWYANAARFVYWTLPTKHPVKTAVLVALEQQFAKDMEAQAASMPPGDLAANPQRADGGIVPIARFTPFGAFTSLGRDGEVAAESVLDPFLPQLSSAIRALAAGQDAFGRKLKTHDGSDPHRAGIAAYALIEAFLPMAQVARRLREKGSTAFSDSTFWEPHTKPNTAHGRSAVGRIFNPLGPTYLGSKGGKVISSPSAASSAGDPRMAKLADLQSRQKVTTTDPRMAKLAALQAARTP